MMRSAVSVFAIAVFALLLAASCGQTGADEPTEASVSATPPVSDVNGLTARDSVFSATSVIRSAAVTNDIAVAVLADWAIRYQHLWDSYNASRPSEVGLAALERDLDWNDRRTRAEWDAATADIWAVYDTTRESIDLAIDAVDTLMIPPRKEIMRTALGDAWRAVPHPDTNINRPMTWPEWADHHRAEAARLRALAIQVERIFEGRP